MASSPLDQYDPDAPCAGPKPGPCPICGHRAMVHKDPLACLDRALKVIDEAREFHRRQIDFLREAVAQLRAEFDILRAGLPGETITMAASEPVRSAEAYVLVCRVCADDFPMPFRSAAGRGEWASVHTEATGHDEWIVVDQPVLLRLPSQPSSSGPSPSPSLGSSRSDRTSAATLAVDQPVP